MLSNIERSFCNGGLAWGKKFLSPPIKFFSLPNNFFKFGDFKKNYKKLEIFKINLITNEPTNLLQ